MALCAVLSWGSVAHGQTAASKFEKGIELFKRGAHGDAAQAFYAAYRISPHPDSLYNAGLAWELAGNLSAAATAFEIALTQGLEPKARADAQKRLNDLADGLGRVEVGAPEGSTIRVLDFVIRKPSVTFYLEPGQHRIGITLPDGTSADRRVVTRAGDTNVLLVEMPSRSRAKLDPEPSDEESGNTRSRRAEKSSAPTRLFGWISLGVAAAAAGTAAVLGVEALSARDTYVDSGNTDRGAKDRAESLRLWANVAWGTAAVTGAGGAAILLLVPVDGAQGSSIRGVTLSGRF